MGAPKPSDDRPRRLHYLDSLKLLLILLVVVHHAIQAYGPADWWYVEGTDRVEALSVVSVVNGSFSMSLFFLIAAYLLPPSYDRKGGGRYLLDRFRQFGPPILVGFLVIIPVLTFFYYVNFRDYPPIGFGTYYLDIYLGLGEEPANWSGPTWPDRQFGHLWFIQHLLVYALFYAAWRGIAGLVASRRDTSAPPARRSVGAPGTVAVLVFVLVVAVATFVLRGWYPVDQWIPVAEFIQAEPADLAQYAAFFVVGLLVYRYDWLSTFSRRAGLIWLGVAVGLTAVHFLMGPELDRLYAMGGWNTGSLLWSVVETLMGTAWIIGLLVAFREWVNRPSRLVAALAPVTFTVYVLHVPVVVALQYGMAAIDVPPLTAFALVAVIGTAVSFAVAWGVRRTPFLRELV
ncbi:acyltransferase family protein [Spiractinospora alimapuensis]|uniref:acyltransferase family protein n=1 Tax=Spiractinospora alimapuensis TaxID=2820884 RepID=UPI001F480070|nr:acyltransferase family protein [Spiractinospora alimapuensis]QVQ51251.1 acyltransferase family protein [Spiractinospora alimapuensis]